MVTLSKSQEERISILHICPVLERGLCSGLEVGPSHLHLLEGQYSFCPQQVFGKLFSVDTMINLVLEFKALFYHFE